MSKTLQACAIIKVLRINIYARSTVKMGSISFNSLKNTNISQQKYTYTDIFLDLAQEPFEIIIGNRNLTGGGRDMKVAYDINAIRNSIVNLFNTNKGDRILLPDYGCDLRQFIFEPISNSRGQLIGRTIEKSVQAWEPRVRIINIDIKGFVDRGEYEINVTLEVPFLQKGQKLNISGLLNRQGFIV